jgi:translation initiation factor IF-2
LNNVPLAGDEFESVDNLDVARERANARAEALRIERISSKAGEGKVTLSSIAASVSSGKQVGIDTHELNIILKVDFQGSVEAIRQAIQVLPQENVSLRFLLQAPGDVSVSDVDLAVASEGIIFGFNVKAPGSVKSYAKKKSVEIRLYKVIYDLIDDLRNAMEGLLELAEEEVPIGSAKVRAVFSSGSGKVAGCMITTGKVVHDCNVRVLRKGKEVYMGTLDSLRRVKETVKEVRTINMNPSTIFISLHSLRKLFTRNITMCFLSITAKRKSFHIINLLYSHSLYFDISPRNVMFNIYIFPH